MATITQPADSKQFNSVAGWSSRARLLVSVLLMGHLLAVFIPPFTFQTSPVPGLGSPLAEAVRGWLRPYLDAAYLNHGYAFFAPDPGPSHLLRARLGFDDGRAPQEITLPDLQRHWPRLLYHRYFMLSEHLHASFTPPRPPREAVEDPERLKRWREARERYVARREAIKAQLRRKYGADRVTLTRLEHRLLDPFEVRGLGRDIDDVRTYRELSEKPAAEEWP